MVMMTKERYEKDQYQYHRRSYLKCVAKYVSWVDSKELHGPRSIKGRLLGDDDISLLDMLLQLDNERPMELNWLQDASL